MSDKEQNQEQEQQQEKQEERTEKRVHPIEEFRSQLLGPMRNEFAKQLPKGLDPDRFVRTVLTVVQLKPELLNATRRSLFGALMMASKDGLIPDGREALVQTYKTNIGNKQHPNWVFLASYMPMVGGMIKKMYEVGCPYVDGAAVYEKDYFRFRRGDNPSIEHEPDIASDDPGPVIAAYAIVKLPNGEIKREVMPRRDIEKARAASKAGDGPGWKNWYDQFAIKSVLKRIYKQLPHEISEGLEGIIEHDNSAMGFRDTGETVTAAPEQDVDVPKAIEHQRPSRLHTILDEEMKRTAADRREEVPVNNAAEPEVRGEEDSGDDRAE